MTTTTKTTKWIIDRPDPNALQREREALASLAVSGNFSSETYRERLKAQRRATSTDAERKASRAFNRRWRERKHKGHPCTNRRCQNKHVRLSAPGECYWCQRRTGKRTAPAMQVPNEAPGLRMDTKPRRSSRDALWL